MDVFKHTGSERIPLNALHFKRRAIGDVCSKRKEGGKTNSPG